MRLAIIGTGNVGGTLGRVWAGRGHEVIFGVRDPKAAKLAALLEEIGPSATAASVAEAVAAGEVVVLAVPWSAAQDVVTEAVDLEGKILIDATNPIGPGLESAVGEGTSGAEQIERWAVGARVVKAYNTVGAENLEQPQFGDQTASMLICGDDDDAKAVVAQLTEELGFETVDAGPLSNARLLEALAVLWIRLALVEGLGRGIAFRLLRR